MSLSEVPLGPLDVDTRILSLLHRYQRLTFTSLADSLPEYKWGDLLSALMRLHAREEVRLTALRWDYEVKLPAEKGGIEGKPRSSDLAVWGGKAGCRNRLNRRASS